jgi:hypothetical protein
MSKATGRVLTREQGLLIERAEKVIHDLLEMKLQLTVRHAEEVAFLDRQYAEAKAILEDLRSRCWVSL